MHIVKWMWKKENYENCDTRSFENLASEFVIIINIIFLCNT